MTARLFVSDTHPLVWFITGQLNRLPKKVKTAFDEAVEGKSAIFIPAVVFWELSLLIKAGRVRPSVPLDEYFHERFFAKAISILPIETEDILLSHKLMFGSDPFDTLIVATALRVDCPLITGDKVIHREKPCEIFW